MRLSTFCGYKRFVDLTRPRYVDILRVMTDLFPSFRTTDEVIDFLGGNGPTGDIVGAKPKTVSNWREAARGRFPAETFLALNRALKRRGRGASPHLWGMIADRAGNAPAGLQPEDAFRSLEPLYDMAPAAVQEAAA